MEHIPALIVGAGPTGLTMAAELKRHGIDCRIIDKLAHPVRTSNALGMQARTMEALGDMDIIDALFAAGIKLKGMEMYANKQCITRIDLDSIDSLYPFVLGIPQQQTEAILNTHLNQLGVQVERPIELLELTQTEEEKSIATLQLANKQKIQMSTDWIIGCDGSHSAVREKLGLAFSGEDLEEHFIMADVKVKWDLSQQRVHAFFSNHGVMAIIPFGNQGYARIIAEVSNDPQLAREKNPSLEVFKRLATKRCHFPIELSEPIWTSGFWIHRRITSCYQKDNIFLLGDAAHVHSPAGGQGMNTGIQDAHNLAWKLALVIKGKINPTLLESYEIERRPIAENVLKQTTRMTKMLSLRNPLLQKLRNWLIRIVTSNNKIKENFAKQVSEVAINYHHSPLSVEVNEANNSAFKQGPKAGDHAPNLMLGSEHNTLYDKIASTTWALVLFTGKSTNTRVLKTFADIQDSIKAEYPDTVTVYLIKAENIESLDWSEKIINDQQDHIHKRYGAESPCVYLIRPDRYIGFRCQPPSLPNLLKYTNKIL